MEYPLISEYREAILSAEDNFNELYSLRPVLDGHGDPIMSSGNFAVVFKMRDINDGKLYAVKCFIKDQEGRDESYRKIADELEAVSSSYILPLRYLENELFVDSAQCDKEEFPVVVMEWVDGETLDAYLNRNLDDKYELEMLSYRFNLMAAWLLAQPFAHGDLKPDNILVRKDGSLVLVDYDGMFVPTMKGEKAREIGSPDYRHPSRTDTDFDEHIDDFSIAVIALSLKVIELNPRLKLNYKDTPILSENDFMDPINSVILKQIHRMLTNADLAVLFGLFSIALANNSLDLVSFKLFINDKSNNNKNASNTLCENHRKEEEKKISNKILKNKTVNINDIKDKTSVSLEDIAKGLTDKYGILYSVDGKRLLRTTQTFIGSPNYNIKNGTEVIGDLSFSGSRFLQSITIPNSVKFIGDNAFSNCEALLNLQIPDSVTSLGDTAFINCKSLQSVNIPNSVVSIGNRTFINCRSLKNITIPNSVLHMGSNPFVGCPNLQLRIESNSHYKLIDDLLIDQNGLLIACLNNSMQIRLPDCVTAIGDYAFSMVRSSTKIIISNNISYIGQRAFPKYIELDLSSNSYFKLIEGLLLDTSGLLISCFNNSSDILIPKCVTAIGDSAFSGCTYLKSITIQDNVKSIGDRAFLGCSSLYSVVMTNSITTIGTAAFSNCNSLTTIKLSDSLTSIQDKTFLSCRTLRALKIPNSVTSIGKSVFWGCYALEYIEIPNNLKRIKNNPFMHCGKLATDFGFLHKESVSLKLNLSSNKNFKLLDNFLIDMEGTLIAYLGNLSDITLPNIVSALGPFAFAWCDSIKKISIPNSVISIGDKAFMYCGQLNQVTIPDSVIKIGYSVFQGCSLLKNISLPKAFKNYKDSTITPKCLITIRNI
ncbi:MAG: leucine-rich repeat protein [Ruminococcus sp.]|nr:leucine-rich repeat protein [Ruminococcus sp.]